MVVEASRNGRRVAWHHHLVSGSTEGAGTAPTEPEPSPLALEQSPASRIAPRYRLDHRTFFGVIVAVLVVLAVLATVRNSTVMLTRISIGVLIALALDPLVRRLQARSRLHRGSPSPCRSGVLAVAALLVSVLAPRAVAQVQQFSEQFPDTVGELEQLPVVGDWIGEQDLTARAERWVASLPEQFTDERLADPRSR